MQNDSVYMNKSIDFYFDIISPYAFIAHKKIKKNYKNEKILFNYMPILLGGLHNLAGITAPAFNKFKMLNMKNDCDLVSKKNDIKFKWNDKFPINSLYIMRGYLLIKKDLKQEYINKFFDAYWINNKDISEQQNVNSILDQLNIEYVHNTHLVRGLDYYNDIVFEWKTKKLGAQGTVCAGGRYNSLIAQLNNDSQNLQSYNAVGFAVGIERLTSLSQTSQNNIKK